MSFIEIGTIAMSCPVCGAQSKRLFVKSGYPIHECVACQHRFVALQPGIHCASCNNTEQVSLVRANNHTAVSPYLMEADVLQSYGWRYAEMFKAYMPLGTVLDVGAAAGFTLKGVLERGWHGVGLEPNRRLADYGRTHLGLPLVAGDLEHTAVPPAKKAPFDLIMMIQSIAQFQDLHKALANASVLTRPNGFWFIETWDRSSWPAQLLGRHWHEYNPPHVLHWFSPAGIVQLADQYGFVEVARGRPQKLLSGAYMKLRLQDKLQSLPGHHMLHTPLSIIPDQVKIRQPSFDLFWILLQKRTKPRLYSVLSTPAPHYQTKAVALN